MRTILIPRIAVLVLIITFLRAILVLGAQGPQLNLNVLQFPERRSSRVEMTPEWRVAAAEMEARVDFETGQTRIEISYKKMKPAVPF